MFLTITTTGSAGRPATDLGFLLHKHPGLGGPADVSSDGATESTRT
ncbi:hypothetical protein test1122_21830 [Streptomyces gobiensis]|nr:hypothetical protein [Streptomyces gobiensis]UGY94095.1 hypothetical protein test1122_21830 [Streptomyces gobiensis]